MNLEQANKAGNLKRIQENGLAYLTHYLQNLNDPQADPEFLLLCRENAENYIKENKTALDLEKIKAVNYKDIPCPPVQNPEFRFIDLFAGIGGFRTAFQRLGGKCVFSSEWDKFAKVTYEANYGEVPFGDITAIDPNEIPDHDILLGGFPCQPFSLAGVSKKNSLGRAHGFLDKVQGTLFFNIAEILTYKRPHTFLLENVKNLVSHDKGKTFNIIKDTLNELDYEVYTKVIDGSAYVPQHRERIFIVGFDRNHFKRNEEFSFPEPAGVHHPVKEILDQETDPKYTLSDKLWNYLQAYAAGHREKGNGFGYGLVNPEGIARTMSARYYKDGAEILVPQDGLNPRRLTPEECRRLMGYPDSFVIPVSDNQAYKQFGNSVIVPVVEAVGREITKTWSNFNTNKIKVAV